MHLYHLIAALLISTAAGMLFPVIIALWLMSVLVWLFVIVIYVRQTRAWEQQQDLEWKRDHSHRRYRL